MISSVKVREFDTRIAYLLNLRDGWHDGGGRAPTNNDVLWLRNGIMNHAIPLPYMYPIVEGGIVCEWDVGSWMADLHLHLFSRGRVGELIVIHKTLPDSLTEEYDFLDVKGREWDHLFSMLNRLDKIDIVV